MTTPLTPQPWDDSRLDAAFAARATAGPTPGDLTERTIASVRRGPAGRSLGWRYLVPAMATVAVAAIVAVSVAGLGAPSPRTPDAAATSLPSSTPDSGETTTLTMGLPVLDVAGAIAIRDAGVDDRELAVRGWYAPHAPPRACGPKQFPASVHPLQVRCPDQLLWLTQDREQLTTMSATTTSYRGPSGLAVSPHFDDVDMAWADPADDPYRPAGLVVIGHFDDIVARQCPAAEQAACRDRFVVDRIDSIDGVEQPLSVVDWVDGAELSTPDDIRAAVELEAPGRLILSMVIVEGRLTDGSSSTAWIAKVLGQREVEHHVVLDGTDTFVMPPLNGATILELPIEVGSGQAPVRVAVIDQTGRLVNARAPSAAEKAVRDTGMRMVWADDLPDDRVLVQWGGSMCDDRLTLTISTFDAGTPFSLTVDGRRGSPCRLALVHYAVVLEFQPAIGAADLGGRYLIGP